MSYLRSEQAREIIRCKNDIGYFARNYCWVRHPAMPFPLRFVPWDWQISLLYLFQARRSYWILKSRQQGFTWTQAIAVNWAINFYQSEHILILSSKEDKAKSVMSKIKYIYERMPSWMRADCINNSKQEFKTRIRAFNEVNACFEEGFNKVESLTTTGSSGAGESATRIICDEVGLWKERQDDEQIWAAIAPTTTHGGQIAGGSTPRGCGGVFHRVWVECITPMMNDGVVDGSTPYRLFNRAALEYYRDGIAMIPLMIHYSMAYHDEAWVEAACEGMAPAKQKRIRQYFGGLVYDEEWRDEQMKKAKLASSKAAQEYELDFERPGDAAFDSASLNRSYMPPTKFPKVKESIKHSTKFYIGVDTAWGASKSSDQPDYNSITALNDNGVQSGAIHNRNLLSQWAGTTKKLPDGKTVEIEGDVLGFIKEHLPCDVLIEKQGGGMTVLNRVDPHAPIDANIRARMMDSPFKIKLVSDFALALESGDIVITDYFTLMCLQQYINKGNGRYEASPGFYDDPVISLMLAYFLLMRAGYYHTKLDEEMIGNNTTIVNQVIEGASPDEVGVTMGVAPDFVKEPPGQFSDEPARWGRDAPSNGRSFVRTGDRDEFLREKDMRPPWVR